MIDEKQRRGASVGVAPLALRVLSRASLWAVVLGASLAPAVALGQGGGQGLHLPKFAMCTIKLHFDPRKNGFQLPGPVPSTSPSPSPFGLPALPASRMQQPNAGRLSSSSPYYASTAQFGDSLTRLPVEPAKGPCQTFVPVHHQAGARIRW